MSTADKRYRVLVCLDMFDIVDTEHALLNPATTRAAQLREHGCVVRDVETDTWTHYPVHRIQSVRVEPEPQ
jgi:hypothetical protein